MRSIILSCMFIMAAEPANADDVQFLTNESLQRYEQGYQETEEYPGEDQSAASTNAEVNRITEDYLKLYRTGEPAKALKYLWNWDVFCTNTFGRSYTSLKSSDRIKAQELALGIATAPFQNVDILAGMKSAKFLNRRYKTDRNGNVQFSFEARFQDGTSGGQTTLYITKVKGRFWFVDLYNNGLLSNKLGSDFASAKLTLLSFLDIVRKESSKLGETIREEWLHGTWELAYDPDNNDKDWIVFGKLGKFILKGPKGPDYEGYYSIKSNKLILGIKVNDRVRTTEMAISDDRTKLTNESGAYYRRISKL